MTDPVPAHGCMIDGQPAMPILISEYNTLVGRVAELEHGLADADAALNQVRALAGECEARGHGSGYPLTVTRIRAALDAPGPAATQATDTACICTEDAWPPHCPCRADEYPPGPA